MKMEKIKNKHGFILYCDDINVGNTTELRRIFVDEGYRGEGVGSALLKELIKIAKKKGKNTITVYSSSDPEKEVFGKFLVARGFEKMSTYNNYGDQWVLTI